MGERATEPQVMPVYSNTSLIFSFEGALATENILEESPPSKTAPAGTSVMLLIKLLHLLSIALLSAPSCRFWLLI